ncbi:hypothetical protein WAI453_013262 [Rhynchosporium graminicola]
MSLLSSRTLYSSFLAFFGITIFLVAHYWPESDSNSLSSITKSKSLLRRDSFETSLSSDDKNSSIFRREDYTCGPGNPCSNGACYGVSGYCSYSATYCGTRCVSNYSAFAEYGKDAVPSGKTCPLNSW